MDQQVAEGIDALLRHADTWSGHIRGINASLIARRGQPAVEKILRINLELSRKALKGFISELDAATAVPPDVLLAFAMALQHHHHPRPSPHPAVAVLCDDVGALIFGFLRQSVTDQYAELAAD